MYNTAGVKKVSMVVLGLFLFGCACGSVAAAEKKTATKKRVRYVKSKHGLKALIELSKSRDEMVKELKEETGNYSRVQTAISCGELREGMSAAEVAKICGEPVIVLSGEEGERGAKWVYKPGTASFFSTEKLYLIFDEKEELVGWKLPPREKTGPDSNIPGGAH